MSKLNLYKSLKETIMDKPYRVTLYGAMLEATVIEDFGLMLAYNESEIDDGKMSFTGFGGGTFFTKCNTSVYCIKSFCSSLFA